MTQKEIASAYMKTAYEDVYLELGNAARTNIVRAYDTLGYSVMSQRIDEIIKKFKTWITIEKSGNPAVARTSLEKFIEDFTK